MTRTDINQATPCIFLKEKKWHLFESTHSHVTSNAGCFWRENLEVVTSRGQTRRGTTEHWGGGGGGGGGGHGTLKIGGKHLEAMTGICHTKWRGIVRLTVRQNAFFAMTYLPFVKDLIIVTSPVNCNTGIKAKGSWWTKREDIISKIIVDKLILFTSQSTVATLNCTIPRRSKLN